MYVKCPHCEILFELGSEVVVNSEGWVQCGSCMQPFDTGFADKYLSEEQGSIYTGFRQLLAIVLAVLVLIQSVNANKPALFQTVFGRPLVNLWCDVAGCSTGELVQVDQIDLVHTSVSAHESQADVLVVEVHMISRTPLGQPHPSIQLTLTDNESMPVARRVFAADEYLPGFGRNELRPNTIKELKLEIANPPNDAVGFEVALVD